MDASHIKPGMLVDYQTDAVEVLSVNLAQSSAEVRRFSDDRHLVASFEDLAEDPQLHTDCQSYY